MCLYFVVLRDHGGQDPGHHDGDRHQEVLLITGENPRNINERTDQSQLIEHAYGDI